MASFKRFEEIDAWQKCRSLSKTIFDETRQGMFARDFRLRDQINASCGSVMDNIAEGFERRDERIHSIPFDCKRICW
jgi:four helix bundle protein